MRGTRSCRTSWGPGRRSDHPGGCPCAPISCQSTANLADRPSRAAKIVAGGAQDRFVGALCHSPSMTALALIAFTAVALVGGLCLGLVVAGRQASLNRRELREELSALSAQAVADSSGQVLALADSRVHATAQVVEPVRQSLDRLNDRLAGLEQAGSSWQAQLKQQVESVHVSGEELRRETRALAEALRRPQVRGHWGEMQLRRSLEIAGLTARCTFDEQVSVGTDDGV